MFAFIAQQQVNFGFLLLFVLTLSGKKKRKCQLVLFSNCRPKPNTFDSAHMF